MVSTIPSLHPFCCHDPFSSSQNPLSSLLNFSLLQSPCSFLPSPTSLLPSSFLSLLLLPLSHSPILPSPCPLPSFPLPSSSPGKPTLSILTSPEGDLYLNVSLYPSSLHQPWQLLVRFTDTTSPAMRSSITLNGIDSSPSLYLVPPSQLPSSFSAYTVAVAVMVGDTTGPYSSEVTTNGKESMWGWGGGWKEVRGMRTGEEMHGWASFKREKDLALKPRYGKAYV